MKNFFLVLLAGTLALLSCELWARHSVKMNLNLLPSVPDTPDRFGNFARYLEYSGTVGLLPSTPIDYVPCVVYAWKPNSHYHFKNIDVDINSIGFRGDEIELPKPKGVFRVVILGGSTVNGYFNERWTISYYLQQKLRKSIKGAEVINAGMVGYSSGNELILLETKILDLEPDVVIVLDGVNDLLHSVNPDWSRATSISGYADEQRLLDALVNRFKLFPYLIYGARQYLPEIFLKKIIASHIPHRISLNLYPKHCRIKLPATDNYLDNLKFMKAVLEAKGLPGLLVFQPILGYCKSHTTSYEKSTFDYFRNRLDTDLIEEENRVWPLVGARLPSTPVSDRVQVYDLTCLLNEMKYTAYIDSMHYTPAACKKIGDVLAEKLLTRGGWGNLFR